MFCVYGVTKETVHRKAVKRLEGYKIQVPAGKRGEPSFREPTLEEYEQTLYETEKHLWGQDEASAPICRIL